MKERNRVRLRQLAETYATCAQGAVMAQRREKWRLHNGLHQRTFPFHIEDNGTFFQDLMPPLACDEPECRHLEAQLLGALTAFERINDDRIIPNRFVVDWVTPTDGFCDDLQFTHADDGHGGRLGYASNKPIRDIDRDIHILKRRTMTVDRPATEQRAELAAEVFKELLPVEIGRCGSAYSNGIANKAVHLMGMEELYLEMAANPEGVHRLLTFLADDNIALGLWEQQQGLLTLNTDGNQGYCSGSSQVCDQLPGRSIAAGEPVQSTDRYGYLEAQEAAGMSPDMFAEFLMPHFRKIAEQFGLLKFGCCEPVHDFIVHLKTIPSLRKVSVTPWCDQVKLAAACPRNVIWCRKPVPLKLCGTRFDPVDFRNHLRETLDLGADFFVEFVFRDTNLLTGAMEARLRDACRIVREVTGHPEGDRG